MVSQQKPLCSLGRLINRQLTRRSALSSLVGSLAASLDIPGAIAQSIGRLNSEPRLTFSEVPHGFDETHHLATGYRSQVLISWGDPVLPNAPAFDPLRQSSEAQRMQFGYNNDFLAYLPLPAGSENSDHGLLVVNHEYTSTQLMFPGLTRNNRRKRIRADQIAVEMAAHGVSVVEIGKVEGNWLVVENSRFARRVIPQHALCEIHGPAAGHERLRTRSDPTGRLVRGTLQNCGGGKTPWGTVLSAEENFNVYFHGELGEKPEAANHARYGIGARPWYVWWKHHERFNVAKEPHEPNRFGWLVEIDPYDPDHRAKKRTALGRFKHEGACVVSNFDGRIVVYSADDDEFEYLYRFVSRRPYDSTKLKVDTDILDDGTLYVARFDNKRMRWLPLIFGTAPLTQENGFHSQADVLIDTRRAADLVGATPLDRPEGMASNRATGRIYLSLSYNMSRTMHDVEAANPRGPNPSGHIIELQPPGAEGARDHAASTFAWNIFILSGDPSVPQQQTLYHPDVSLDGWFAAPDNLTVDPWGRLWIATDQGEQFRQNDTADGLYACTTIGEKRALTRHFFRAPIGAEVCGPEFTPDGRTLFLSVQHPGYLGDVKTNGFDNPGTRWPDFDRDTPPRPAVLAITKSDGGVIGG